MELKIAICNKVKIRVLIIILISIFFSKNGATQTLCSALVDTITGNITVRWNDLNPTLTQIYTIKWGATNTFSDGTYIETTCLANNFYTIPVNANTTKYYIQIEYLLKSGATSKMVITPIFVVVEKLMGDGLGNFGVAKLSWNPVNQNLVGTYNVERLEAGIWKILTTYPTNPAIAEFNYFDTIAFPFCPLPSQISYRVSSSVTGATLYSSLSNIVSEGPFIDITNPSPPINDTISAYENSSSPSHGQNIIGWSPSLSKDIKEYKIYRRINPTATLSPIGTTPANVYSFIDPDNASKCNSIYEYAVVAVDKCGNESDMAYAVPFRKTIKINVAFKNSCDREMNLTWTKYESMPGGVVSRYKIYRRSSIGSYDLVADIPASSGETYTDKYAFVKGQSYYYMVRAFDLSGKISTSSCQNGSEFTGPDMPDSVYIPRVSVEQNSYIRIWCRTFPKNTVKKIILERSVDGVLFKEIDFIEASAANLFLPDTLHFDDKKVSVNDTSYYYRLVAYDECGTRTLSQNIGRSILLKCSNTETDYITKWNPYETWFEGVETYQVHRMVGESLANEVTFYKNDTTYSDPISGINPTQKICYQVIAQEKPKSLGLTQAKSVSNTCCIIKDHTLFLPNAFHPGSNNNTRFRPVPDPSYVDLNSFSMVIFSRWGQQIFETNDIVNGWDGKANGQLVPLGLYGYIITYKSLRNEYYTKRGTVFVVR